jgi:signal transduction histidine kinase
MLVVVAVALVAVPVATAWADRAALASLPEAYRQRLNVPRPGLLVWIFRDRPGARAPLAVSRDAPVLQRELEALVGFVSDSRAARTDATILAVAVVLLLSALFAVWLSRSVARPIAAVSEASARLATGALATRVELPNPERQPRETRELTEGFNRMAAAMERYEGERQAMFADVAHELRTPLATLRLRLEAMHDGLVPMERDELRALTGQVDLLSRLVGDLRLLSLAEGGHLTVTLQPVAVGAWLRESTATWGEALAQHGVRLDLTLPEADATWRFDPQRMEQVLHNLIDNALRFAPRGSALEVRSETTEDALQLSVRDHGPGIPETDVATVFERFVSGRRRDERGSQGSGLGLAIVRALVGLHGGEVSAENVADGGARLTVRLPQAPRA